MLLIVIVKKSVVGCFGAIRGTATGIGIMGLMVCSFPLHHSFFPPTTTKHSLTHSHSQGNKGGTALRLSLFPTPTSLPTTLTFVNAHLAAFDEFAEKRNSDYTELGRRLTFQTGFAYEGVAGRGPDGVIVGTGSESVWESDLLVWMVSRWIGLGCEALLISIWGGCLGR